MLSQVEITNIETTISECETRSDLEFVPVIVKQSDLYPAAHFRASICLGLLVPIGLYYLPWSFYDPIWYLYAQLPALIVGYLLAYHRKIKRLFSTRFEIAEEVRQRAGEYFLNQGLYNTNKRSAILIFISLLEHRIEIIADKNVIGALETGAQKTLLREQIKIFQKEMKTDSLFKALDDLIKNLTREIAPHLPKSAAPNEIPDQIQLGTVNSDPLQVQSPSEKD